MERTPASAWPTRPLGSLADRIFLGLADTRQRGTENDSTVALLNVRDLHDGHVPASSMLVKRTIAPGVDVQKYAVRSNDVVITCRGTQLKIATITPLTEGALISANLIAIRAGSELLPPVLFAFLQSPATQKALLQRGRSSTSSLSLTPRAVADLSIALPPLEVQKQIANLIDSAEQNYVAATRSAEQRRSVAHAIAIELLLGKHRSHQEQRG